MARAATEDHADRINSQVTRDHPSAPTRGIADLFTPVSRQLLVPRPAGRIVVRAGVDHCVCRIVVRQVWILGLAIKPKLQDTHSRKVELVAQRVDIGRDVTQILGNEW